MQKSKLVTSIIVVIILIYGILANTNIVFNIYGLFLYIINPIFWIILSGVLYFSIAKIYTNTKLRKKIIQYTTVAVLTYLVIYLLSGLFVTFGNNPYNTTLKGLIINFWILGVPIFAKEYIRYKLINNVYDRDKMNFAIFISIVYVLIDIEYARLIGQNVATLTIIKYCAQVIAPSIAKNISFSYIAIQGDFVPSVLYQLITNLYYWISPILPNSPWAMSSIIDTVIPIILCLYIRYEKVKLTPKKDRRMIIDTNPGSIIPLVISIVLVIWFALGVFPIKPIAIATGSMEKEICVGDVAIIQKCKGNDVNVGDIIEYQMEGYTVIHRIIEKKQENGEFHFVTKGDNNISPDNEIVRENQLIGKVIFKIKYIGYPAIWMHLLQKEEQMVKVDKGI